MANNYPLGFYFKLSFLDRSFKGEDPSFQEVSGISKELSVEEVACGGENRFKYRLPITSSSHNLVLKRALIPEGSKLLDWCVSCIDRGLASKITTQDLTVSLINPDGTIGFSWTFYKAYPIKYSISDLKSQENALVVESIELAYTYFEVTPDDSIFGNLFD